MIAKRVQMKSLNKSDFSELVKYITDAQSKNERVGLVTVTNCHSDRPDVASTEVLNVQAQNKRAETDKTYHLLVSFRPGEQPDSATLSAIEARLCHGLGYGQHQRISSVHHDTDNLHIHIAINKIHPTRYTIFEPYYDFKTIGKLCEKLEREFGLEPDNHQAQTTGAANRANDMEHHAGVESLLGWIKRECFDQIQNARTWTELHQIMVTNGLALHERGNGLVISAEDGTTVKASSLGRGYAKGKLEARLGRFAPDAKRSADKAEKIYASKPMRSKVDTTELYAQYKNEQQDMIAARALAWRLAREQQQRLVEAAKRGGRFKRAAIKLIKGARLEKKMMYAAVSKTLKADIDKANKAYRKARQEIYQQYRRRAWADWLRTKAMEGDLEALAALRGRHAAQGMKGNTVGGNGGAKSNHPCPGHDSVTKKGTIIYRAGATAVRDDGDRLYVSRGADQGGLATALQMAMARYGDCINVKGSDAFKEQIVQAAAAANLNIRFDDAQLASRHQSLKQPSTDKENGHVQSKPAKRGRSGRGGAGRSRAGTTRAGGARRPGPHRAGGASQPDLGGIGTAPPPASKNRLRRLSELGVVRVTGGSEVLLPGHVSDHLEQQGNAADHPLRRRVPGIEPYTAGDTAAERYIAEREQKRNQGIDIPPHRRYAGRSAGDDAALAYAGMRQVDGYTLALLQRGEEIEVLPVDDATAQRFKRVAIGTAVTVTAQGTIKMKAKGLRR